MITAVDTNVLLDVWVFGAHHQSQSREWLVNAYDRGDVLVCDVVYAELVPAFDDRSQLDGALRAINATTSSVDTNIAYEAGLRWSRYRRSGGPRTRLIADFLIGAHAIPKADAFLTRDQRFYATYFPELR